VRVVCACVCLACRIDAVAGDALCGSALLSGGPACFVENDAGRPVIDASYSACGFFTGSSPGDHCGWSDKISIKCSKTAEVPLNQTDIFGPCSNNPSRGLPQCGLPVADGGLSDSAAAELLKLMHA
jgi:hypothetical protein